MNASHQLLNGPSPSINYFYCGKSRNREDWPDLREQNSSIQPLSEAGVTGELIESTHFLKATHKSVIALVRTTSGPTKSAIEKAINDLMDYQTVGWTFELVPFIRTDQFEKMQQATGATKMHLKLAPGSAVPPAASSDAVGQAFERAQEVANSNLLSVDLQLSFGNSNPDESSRRGLLKSLRNLAGSPAEAGRFAKAQATLTMEDEDGQFVRQKIDLIADRVTIKEQFSQSSDEQPDSKRIVQGLLDACSKFRETIKETSTPIADNR